MYVYISKKDFINLRWETQEERERGNYVNIVLMHEIIKIFLIKLKNNSNSKYKDHSP